MSVDVSDYGKGENIDTNICQDQIKLDTSMVDTVSPVFFEHNMLIVQGRLVLGGL